MTWSFPPDVSMLLQREFAGKSVLHLFGGRATFGTRMDIDPLTRPDVVGDCWLPPFAAESFDVVIMDPPYVGAFSNINQQKGFALFAPAAWIAREKVVWFSPIWLPSLMARCRLVSGYTVVVGGNSIVRGLQIFSVPERGRKLQPPFLAERGPALKYRWIYWQEGLALTRNEPTPPEKRESNQIEPKQGESSWLGLRNTEISSLSAGASLEEQKSITGLSRQTNKR